MRTIAGLALGFIATASWSVPLLSPQQIQHEFEKSGPTAVVNRLYKSGAYDRVMDGIKAGSVEWIMLAPALSDGADAATAEELSNALIYALPKAPAAVLTAIASRPGSVSLSIDSVCTPAFFEGDSTNPARWKAAAIHAVQTVTNQKIRKTKRSCLTRLSKGS